MWSLGLLEVLFLPWWAFAISIPKGSVVSTGDKPGWFVFILLVRHLGISCHTAESPQGGTLTSRERAVTETTLTLRCLPLSSRCCASFSVCPSLCPASCLSLCLPPVALPTHPSLPPPSFFPFWSSFFPSVFLLSNPLTNWTHKTYFLFILS